MTFWKAERDKTLERDGWRCLKCGATEDLTVDHIVPASVWKNSFGTDLVRDNLQVLCERCNLQKGTKIISYRKDGGALNSIMRFVKLANRDEIAFRAVR